jgi:hypothetical protein
VKTVPIYYNTLLRHRHHAKKELQQLWQQKSHDKNNHLQYSYYAITQKHFATTVLSLESYDSNLPLVIVTLILMDSVWN